MVGYGAIEFYCTEFGLVICPGMAGETPDSEFLPHMHTCAVAGESQDTVLLEMRLELCALSGVSRSGVPEQ